MSLAWRWVSNRGLWTVYKALYAPPCMKEREQAPIAVIKQWKDVGKKRRDIVRKEDKLSRKKSLCPWVAHQKAYTLQHRQVQEQSTVPDKNSWDTSTKRLYFFLLTCLLYLPILFIAVNSQNLVYHHWMGEKIGKYPNNNYFGWEFRSCWPKRRD